ncbi:MAG: molybdenum cofactor biosynthesis protein C [Chloroflexi bacterium RBG_13_54_9]|nr:MAG: molybdenum cofactor biosynthesis protein C [Chloroflexi bacterium RBG_13_54_9]
MEKLSHLDAQGKARMVDISDKDVTQREAMAKSSIVMKPATFALLKGGKVEKGDVLSVAQVAGIMAAKQTPHLIPMCHPLLLTDVKLDFELDEKASAVNITATVKTNGKTGVEMEALTAVAVSALTIYDMCKAADASMRIEGIRLVKKSGGKSGTITLE